MQGSTNLLNFPKLDPTNDEVKIGPPWTVHAVVAAATINATVIKASAGRIGFVHAIGAHSAPVYLKFWDKATAPDPSADSALWRWTIILPASGLYAFPYSIPAGLEFNDGIAYAITAAVGITDETAVGAGHAIVTIGTA